MSKKTTAILTTVGFAIFASPALADRPDEPGKQGRDNAAEQQVRQAEKRSEQEAKKEAKQTERETEQAEKQAKRTKKAKGVGFALSGVGLTSLPVADGALTGPLTLDVTSANKHARTLLDITKTDIDGTSTFPVGTSGDEVVVRFEGLTATDALQATDRVKVIGKVTRVRKGDTTTTRTLDIKKITVTRETETETETEPEQQS